MNIRSCLLFIALTAVGGRLSAQVEFINVEKIADYNQTDSNTVTLKPVIPPPEIGQPPLSVPYQFKIEVEGESLPQPTFTFPAGSSYNGPTVLLGDESGWSRTVYFSQKYSATGGPGGTPGGLDGIFNNGAYSVTVGETTANVNLGGAANADVYPNAPMASLTAGTWVGGGTPTLLLDASQALTITTNSFSNFYDNGYLNHIDLTISGGVVDIALESFSNNTFFPGAATDDFLSFEFDSFSFTSGQSYFVEIAFNTIVDFSEHEGAFHAALFTSRTQFQIQAIPEPSTYAAILGALALAGVVVARRRSRAGV